MDRNDCEPLAAQALRPQRTARCMSKAERMRMCLAEAGFVEGRDFASLFELAESDGWIILFNDRRDATALDAAIEKAKELIHGRVIPYEEWHGQWTCGPDPKERRAV